MHAPPVIGGVYRTVALSTRRYNSDPVAEIMTARAFRHNWSCLLFRSLLHPSSTKRKLVQRMLDFNHTAAQCIVIGPVSWVGVFVCVGVGGSVTTKLLASIFTKLGL